MEPEGNPPDDNLTPDEEAELAKLEEQAARPWWRRYGLPVAAAAAGAALVFGTLATRSGGGSDGSVISGTITVRADEDDAGLIRNLQRPGGDFALGSPCTGGSVSRGYDDLGPGTGVTVKNERGEIIATGSVQFGQWTTGACRMTFEAEDVPKARFYEIEVGRRGEQRYSRADMEAMDYELDLVIGG